MFNEEWSGLVIIRESQITEPQFPQDKNIPNAFDLCLLVESEDGRSDWWRGPCSSRYGTGNYAGITQMDSTIETLTKIGLPDGDISRHEELIGMTTQATVKASKPNANGKVFYNVKYLGSSTYKPEALDPAEAQRRMQAAMMATQNQGQPANQNQNQGQQNQNGQGGQSHDPTQGQGGGFNGAGQNQGGGFNGAGQNQNQGGGFNGAGQNQNQGGGHGFRPQNG